jgi:hypothetical protein
MVVMKTHLKNLAPVLLLTAFLCLAISPQAGALLFESLVGENGIEVTYDINRRLKGEIVITPEDPWELNILDVIVIQLAVTSIDPNPAEGPPVVHLHYYVKTSLPNEDEFEDDLPIPFGELGIKRDKLNRNFTPLDESNQVDISILSTINRFQYGVSLNFGEIYSDRWEGEATFRDAVITEEVVIDVGELLDFIPEEYLPPEIPQEMRWDITMIPIFIAGSFNWGLVQIDAYTDGDLVSSIPADIPDLGVFLNMLPFLMQKGTTHFWFNSGN